MLHRYKISNSELAFFDPKNLRKGTFKVIKKAFKADYSISDDAAKLYYTYGYIPTAMKPENEELFTAGLEKIPNYNGYVIRHSNLNEETVKALETAFLNEKHIQLSTIVEFGDNKYILAGSPVGGKLVFQNREIVFIIKSKTGKYISPVAYEEEPEVVIVGATKQFKVKNMLQTSSGFRKKTCYFLDEL